MRVVNVCVQYKTHGCVCFVLVRRITAHLYEWSDRAHTVRVLRMLTKHACATITRASCRRRAEREHSRAAYRRLRHPAAPVAAVDVC